MKVVTHDRPTGSIATRSTRSTPPQNTDVGYTVKVVDGDGIEVPGEPVTARFELEDGYCRVLTATTDQQGRARFLGNHVRRPVSVVFDAGQETTEVGEPRPNQLLTIET